MRKLQYLISISLFFCLCVSPLPALADEPADCAEASAESHITMSGVELDSTISSADAEQALIKQANDETIARISDGLFLGTLDNGDKLPLSVAHGSRPYYFNRYGKVQYVSSGYHYVSGQPTGGFNFRNSAGRIYINASSGGSISISHTFQGFGTFGISFPLGQASYSVVGVGVSIPKGGYWKVKMSTTDRCIPYTTYRVANGRTTVFFRGVSDIFYSRSFSRVRVK